MIRIVYFGTAAFAVPPLEALLSAPENYLVAAVVSQPDKPAGRKGEVSSSPVAIAARSHGIELLQPGKLKDPETQARISGYQADLFVVAAYGKIVPRALLDAPRLGCLNLHGSVLPKYRGASPIQAAIAAGETVTGVSLMVMDEQVDHGPVVAAASLPIAADDTHASLERKLGAAAAALLTDNLAAFVEGRLRPQEQDHGSATFTSMLSRDDGFVAWSGHDARTIERMRRAFEPWPGIHAVWRRKGRPLRLKLVDVRVIETPESAPPAAGTVFLSGAGIPAVATKRGALALLEIQPEGKKPMSGQTFLNGYPDLVGSVLESEIPKNA